MSSIGLFYLGIAFAYYVVFPLVFHFMVSMTPVGVSMMTDISRSLERGAEGVAVESIKAQLVRANADGRPDQSEP